MGGRGFVLEYPLFADVAIISAFKADRLGNLTYRKTARNFAPIMASAASTGQDRLLDRDRVHRRSDRPRERQRGGRE
jgi:hypothetical protein